MVVLGSSGLAPAQTSLRPGIEVLLGDSLHLVRGKRVGLLTNQTGVDARGESDVERLLAAGVHLTALFSPEHGFRGTLEQQNIEHGTDSATGLPIYSLYGAVRAPTPAMLDSVDVLLVDLQDIGARTYTYVATAVEALQAAASLARPVVVLDRPNPIGGELVQGPMLEPAFTSFVGRLPVPLRHGMSMGELLRLAAAILGLERWLLVVPVAGWSRSQWFDQTGLPWIRPSPNMPDLESATHYPGLVVFEATNLSVGRGTPVAFQVIGAPWLDPPRVRRLLGEVPGVEVRDTVIRPVAPGDGKYPGQDLPALRFRVRDRGAYDPTRLAARLLEAVRAAHPDRLVIRPTPFDRLAGSDRWRTALEAGASGDSIWRSWQPALAAFRKRRAPYLLYH